MQNQTEFLSENLFHLYRSSDISYFPLEHQTEILYSKNASSPIVIPKILSSYLQRCQAFETLEQHLNNIRRDSNPSQAELESIQALLTELIRSGFLVSIGDLLKKSSRDHLSKDTSTKINSIGIPTHQRIKSLERALSSYVENTQCHGRTARFVIANSAQDRKIENTCQEMLTHLKGKYSCSIDYIGQNEKIEYAHLMSETGIPRPIMDFALGQNVLPFSNFLCGSNRNAFLLHHIDEPFFMADDDTVGKVTSAPGQGKNLVFSSLMDPTEFYFYSNPNEIENVPFVDQDILSAHEEMLGKHLGSCILEFSKRAKVEWSSGSFSFAEKVSSVPSRISASMMGIVGDSGMGSPKNYLFLLGPSRKRLLKSEADYRSYIQNRQILRKANFNTVSERSFCMCGAIALDHRHLLPPFIPFQRNEDGLFGITLRKCFENHYIAHLPWAVLHQPMNQIRSFPPDTIWNHAMGLHSTDILSTMINAYEFRRLTNDAEDRLKELGQYLTDLGGCAIHDFKNSLMQQILKSRVSYISTAENILKLHHETPDYWAKDLKKHLRKVVDGFSANEYNAPNDIQQIIKDPLESWTMLQSFFLKFGELLSWWPEISKAAKALKEQGRSIGKKT